MNLQIGTILIAKDYHYTEKGIKAITKNKEYPINSMDELTEIIFYGYVNDLGMKESVTKAYIEDNFTLKRYTLQDLRDKKIAVKLRNYEEYKRMCEAVGDTDISELYFDESFNYYGVDEWGNFMLLREGQLEGRTVLKSIDLIDLEVKEEVKPYLIIKGATITDESVINYIQQLESEIARLKGELDRLEKENIALSLKDIPMPCEQPTPDQAKRERMAWELYVHCSSVTVDKSFELVDTFLEKSKEVKP